MKHILLILLIFSFAIGKSQNNLLGFMPALPQVQQSNVALYRAEKGYFSLPLISSVNISLASSGMALNEFAERDLYDQTKAAYAWDALANSLDENNRLVFNSKVPIIGLGFKLKKGFLSIDVTQRSFAQVNVPGEIAKLRYLQTEFQAEQSQAIEEAILGFKAVIYNEYKFAYAFQLNEEIRVGVAFKYLAGVGYVDMDHVAISMDYDEQSGGTIKTQGEAFIAGPFDYGPYSNMTINDIETDDVSFNSLLLSKNKGFGFDFGVKWQPNDRLILSMAINDIGKIKWQEGTATFSSDKVVEIDENDAEDGLNMYDVMNDSIINSFTLGQKGVTRKMKLAGNFNVQGEYQLTKWFKTGMSYQRINQYGDKINSYTVCGGLSGKSYSSLLVSYSISDYYDSVLGVGLTTRLGALQPYLLVNSVNGLFNSKAASAVSYVGGINFIFGRSEEKKALKKAKTETL